jgi:hypothetical protein
MNIREENQARLQLLTEENNILVEQHRITLEELEQLRKEIARKTKDRSSHSAIIDRLFVNVSSSSET